MSGYYVIKVGLFPQVAVRFLWENRTLKSAIDYPRLHVDVKSGSIQYEHRMVPRIMYKMAQIGHTLDGDPEEMSFGDRYSCVCGIAMKHGVLYTNADFRAHTGGFDGD
ncbi:hypothetical protein IscW_ISCW013319 [Ixodes scapularis]|uniref:Uncharacterized protein n=1 Tax=Ixodes scapularis TaxID=6945 RepID=B7QDK8_IXOSC|nr:hypothetical protein IscW_ISCW013319 [Ixodes scapularis]|eukprot:XP_002413622.1 hypothetical protein IscW_ISCW013319 [Ixodes scapularis]